MVSIADLITRAKLLSKHKKANKTNFFLAKCVKLIKLKKLLNDNKVKNCFDFNFNVKGEAT